MDFKRYLIPHPNDPLDQGDIFEGCPVPYYYDEPLVQDPEQETPFALPPEVDTVNRRVIVMTQACDLRKKPLIRQVVVCPVRTPTFDPTGDLDEIQIQRKNMGTLTSDRYIGLHYLAADGPERQENPAPTYVVDFRLVYTVPRRLLESLLRDEKRKRRLGFLFREHLAMRFAFSYFRIGLPEPGESEDHAS